VHEIALMLPDERDVGAVHLAGEPDVVSVDSRERCIDARGEVAGSLGSAYAFDQRALVDRLPQQPCSDQLGARNVLVGSP
jgi:hypothetical protein